MRPASAVLPQPNFFLVGASKAGTTSLYNYLAQHPQIFMCPIKEPHFLADEVRASNFSAELQDKIAQWERDFQKYLQGPVCERFPSGPVADWGNYLRLFQGAGDRPAIGEASPCYLWSKSAPGNIAARFPEAKIVMVLRNPVERAFAQHLHTLSFAKTPMSFREHMDVALESTEKRIGELYPFLEFGLYCEQVTRYFDLFGRERVLVLLYEEYLRDSIALMRRIFRFLAVEETFVPDLHERHMESRVPRSFGVKRVLQESGVWRVAQRFVGPGLRGAMRSVVFRPRRSMSLEASDRSRLLEFYGEDVRALSVLLGLDLSSWLRG